MEKEIPLWKRMASLVLHVTFIDENVRTYYSLDINKQPNNTSYWLNHLENLVHKRKQWQGRVKHFAIFRVVNGERKGDPIVQGTPQNNSYQWTT